MSHARGAAPKPLEDTTLPVVRVPMQASLPAALYTTSAVTPAAEPPPVPSPSVEAAPVVTPSAAAPIASTPEVVVPVETAPALDWSVEGKDVGSRWSTVPVNVRTGPGTGCDVISVIAEGRGITITMPRTTTGSKSHGRAALVGSNPVS